MSKSLKYFHPTIKLLQNVVHIIKKYEAFSTVSVDYNSFKSDEMETTHLITRVNPLNHGLQIQANNITVNVLCMAAFSVNNPGQ